MVRYYFEVTIWKEFDGPEDLKKKQKEILSRITEDDDYGLLSYKVRPEAIPEQAMSEQGEAEKDE